MPGLWADVRMLKPIHTGDTTMTNADMTKKFFGATTVHVRDLILRNIAEHYGVTWQDALDEVTQDEAECLLDYVTGPERDRTMRLMFQHGINPFAEGAGACR
jgi:hypothetical protein